MNYEFLEILKSIFTIMTMVVTMSVALYGLEEWKRKLKGRTDYEVARKYLRSVLKLRDAIKYVRNPYISAQEIKKAQNNHGLKSDEYKNSEKENRAVYNERWKRVVEAWTDLELELLEAEVSWGAKVMELQEPLDSCVRKLRSKIELFLRKSIRPEDEMLIYDGGESDEFSKEITNIIQKIEDYLKSYIK